MLYVHIQETGSALRHVEQTMTGTVCGRSALNYATVSLKDLVDTVR